MGVWTSAAIDKWCASILLVNSSRDYGNSTSLSFSQFENTIYACANSLAGVMPSSLGKAEVRDVITHCSVKRDERPNELS